MRPGVGRCVPRVSSHGAVPIRTASFAQVRKPVYPNSVARWKNYQTELADLFAALPQTNGHGSVNA